MRPWLAAALLLAGCYTSHPGGRGDGGVPCGTRTCPADEQCCSVCEGDAICIAGDRMCPVVPCSGCSDRSDCEPDEYCLFADGACGGVGSCEFRPSDCLGESTFPICGCDGRQYESTCEGRARGISVRSSGPCEGMLGCFRNSECARDQYCELGRRCEGPGTCLPRPTVCDPTGVPSCTCEGAVFPNACEAAAAGRTATPLEECGGGTFRCPEFCDWLTTACDGVVPSDTCTEDCRVATGDCDDAEWSRVLSCVEMDDCMIAVGCLSEIPCFFE